MKSKFPLVAAVALAAELRSDVEVLEIDAVLAEPGGEVEEVQGEGDERLVGYAFDDERVHCWRGAEEGSREALLGGDDLIRRSLVLGERGVCSCARRLGAGAAPRP